MSGLYMRTMETPFFPTVYTLLLEDNLVYCGTSQHDILVYTFQVCIFTYQFKEICEYKGFGSYEKTVCTSATAKKK